VAPATGAAVGVSTLDPATKVTSLKYSCSGEPDSKDVLSNTIKARACTVKKRSNDPFTSTSSDDCAVGLWATTPVMVRSTSSKLTIVDVCNKRPPPPPEFSTSTKFKLVTLDV